MQANHPGEGERKSFLWIIVVVAVLLVGAFALYFRHKGLYSAQGPTPVIARGKIPPPPPSPSVEPPAGPSAMLESAPAAGTENAETAPGTPSQDNLESAPTASLDVGSQQSAPEPASETDGPPPAEAAGADSGQAPGENAERNVSSDLSEGRAPASGKDNGLPKDTADNALQAAAEETPDLPQPPDTTLPQPSDQPAAEAEEPASAVLPTGDQEAATPFTIQVGAYRGKDNADRQAALLRKKGYEAYIYEKNEKDRKAWYFVRFGHFEDFGSADKVLKLFKEQQKMDGTVVNSD